MNFNSVTALIGFDFKKLITFPSNLLSYCKNLWIFSWKKNKDNAPPSQTLPITKLYPCFFDKNDSSGSANSQYAIQDQHVAKIVYSLKTDDMIDLGSRIDGFLTSCSVFCNVTQVDIREANSKLQNITFVAQDAMDKPDNSLKNKFSVVTSLHALEHFGLGRYGDPLVVNGHELGIKFLSQLVSSGGTVIISVPVSSKPRIEFDAHRVFSLENFMALINKYLYVKRIDLIDDSGNLFLDIPLKGDLFDRSYSCKYGVGVFLCTTK